jgi:Fe-S-cluster containining protein
MNNSSEYKIDSFVFPANMKFDCKTCGQCCNRDWTVYIGPKAYFGLKDTEVYREIQKKFNNEELFHLDLENRECTIRKFNGRCPMIQDNNLCLIHVEMGIDEKPVPCRYFPHIMAPTPEGVYVGFSFNCPGVTHAETGYEADRDLVRYLGQILDESSDCRVGFGDVPIFEEVVTDWEGYKVIEDFVRKCLEEDGEIAIKTWKAFITLAILVYDCRIHSRKQVSARDIADFLEMPFNPPFQRDQDYQYQEFSYTMFLVTLLETMEAAKRQENLNALMNGGKFTSKTFNTEIQVEHLIDYFNNQDERPEDPRLSEYFKHLVWRKELLKSPGILNSLGLLNLAKTLFDWYFHASAYVRNAESPSEQDFTLAMREVEEVIKHDTNHVIQKYAGDFARSLVDQVTLFKGSDKPHDRYQSK